MKIIDFVIIGLSWRLASSILSDFSFQSQYFQRLRSRFSGSRSLAFWFFGCFSWRIRKTLSLTMISFVIYLKYFQAEHQNNNYLYFVNKKLYWWDNFLHKSKSEDLEYHLSSNPHIFDIYNIFVNYCRYSDHKNCLKITNLIIKLAFYGNELYFC